MNELNEQLAQQHRRLNELLHAIADALSAFRGIHAESETVDRPFVRVTGHDRPATSCGDGWAVHDLPDGRVFLIIGDVTGHGVASAILTGVAKAACDIARILRKNDLQCDELLRMMNTSIYGAGKQTLMMTACVCMIDPRAKKITVSSAGHTFPLLLRNRNGAITAAPIVAHGSPLGASSDSVFPEVTVPLEPNDVLCCYTDGVTECENPLKEQFSERRLRELLIHAGRWDPTAIRDTIEHSLAQLANGAPQADDMTFIIAEVGMI